MINGDSIYCDCCGVEKLAQFVGDNLVIKDRRHGERHVAVLKISDLLDILEIDGHNYSTAVGVGENKSEGITASKE